MFLRGLCAGCICGLLVSCAGPSSVAAVERLDALRGTTVATLPKPIEFVQSDSFAIGKRASFAYLGPVEWDRMGEIRYSLWLNLAPGNGRAIAQFRGGSAITILLDGGTLSLTQQQAPQLAGPPYAPVVAWGQTAYFPITAQDLKRLGASRALVLRLRAVDGSTVDFKPNRDAKAIMTRFLRSRHLVDD